MSTSLLIYSQTFSPSLKKIFNPSALSQMDVNSDALKLMAFNSFHQMSELVKCLFPIHDKLTICSNFNSESYHAALALDNHLVFILNPSHIKDTYELNDLHASVMYYFKSQKLLIDTHETLKKQLLSAELSCSVENLELLKTLIKEHEKLILKSNAIIEGYRTGVVARFGKLTKASKWK